MIAYRSIKFILFIKLTVIFDSKQIKASKNILLNELAQYNIHIIATIFRLLKTLIY